MCVLLQGQPESSHYWKHHCRDYHVRHHRHIRCGGLVQLYVCFVRLRHDLSDSKVTHPQCRIKGGGVGGTAAPGSAVFLRGGGQLHEAVSCIITCVSFWPVRRCSFEMKQRV